MVEEYVYNNAVFMIETMLRWPERFTDRTKDATDALVLAVDTMDEMRLNTTDRMIRQLDYLARNPGAVIVLDPGIKRALETATDNLEAKVRQMKRMRL